MPDDSSLICVMGVPGSGKSSWIDYYHKNRAWIVLDNFFERDRTGRRFWLNEKNEKIYWGNPGFSSKQWIDGSSYLWNNFLECLEKKIPIAIEGIFQTWHSRLPIAHCAKFFGYRTELVWIKPTLVEILQRNRNRKDSLDDKIVVDFFLQMEDPIKEEGWDVIRKVPGI